MPKEITRELLHVIVDKWAATLHIGIENDWLTESTVELAPYADSFLAVGAASSAYHSLVSIIEEVLEDPTFAAENKRRCPDDLRAEVARRTRD